MNSSGVFLLIHDLNSCRWMQHSSEMWRLAMKESGYSPDHQGSGKNTEDCLLHDRQQVFEYEENVKGLQDYCKKTDNDASEFIRKEFDESFVHKYHKVFLRTGPLSENPLEVWLSFLSNEDKDGDSSDNNDDSNGAATGGSAKTGGESAKTGGGKKLLVGGLGSRTGNAKKGRTAQHAADKATATEVKQEAVFVSSKACLNDISERLASLPEQGEARQVQKHMKTSKDMASLGCCLSAMKTLLF